MSSTPHPIPEPAAGAVPDTCTMAGPSGHHCGPEACVSVGTVRHCTLSTADLHALSDTELELHIQACGHLIERAMAHGNRQEAEGWQQAMYQAIAARSEAHKARMQAASEQRLLDEGVGYFCSDAGLDLGRARSGRTAG